MSILNARHTPLLALLAAALALPAAAQLNAPLGKNADLAPRAVVRAAVPASPLHFADRLIVKYKTASGSTARSVNLHVQSLQGMAVGYGVEMRYARRLSTGGELYTLGRKLSLPQAFKLARHLMRQDPGIAYAEPDVMNVALSVPAAARPRALLTDPLLDQQWDLTDPVGGVNAPAAWDRTRGAGAVVAVLDTGYRPHADLVGNVLPGYDFIGDTDVSNDGDGRDTDATDPGDDCGSGSSWHGTHVSGTIAAVGNNGIGIAGVAPEAKILPVRVLGKCGGHTSDIVDGLAWATGAAVDGVPANTTPARVVNMSLGSEVPCLNTYREALANATQRGAVVVVAGGNGLQNARNAQPAGCPGAVAVAATNRAGGRAYYSNYGAMITVAAPGGEMTDTTDTNGILSTFNDGASAPGNDSYAYDQGTSMAAPHVAGVVALMLSANPKLTVPQVRQVLTSTARRFPAACAGCGAGIVDADAAVRAAQALR